MALSEPSESKGVQRCYSVAMYFVYILRTLGNALYVGVTEDIAQRLTMHNSGKGAKWMKAIIVGDATALKKLSRSRSTARGRHPRTIA